MLQLDSDAQGVADSSESNTSCAVLLQRGELLSQHQSQVLSLVSFKKCQPGTEPCSRN